MNFQQDNRFSPYRKANQTYKRPYQPPEQQRYQSKREYDSNNQSSPSFRRSPQRYKEALNYTNEPIWQKLYKDGLNNKKILLEKHQDSKNRIDTQCTFQPILKHNKRYLASSNSTFLERVQIWQENKIQKIIKEKQEEVDKDLKECTFVPKLNVKRRQYLLSEKETKRFQKSQTILRNNKSKIVNPYYSPIKKQKINTQAKKGKASSNYIQLSQAKAMIRTQLKRIAL